MGGTLGTGGGRLRKGPTGYDVASEEVEIPRGIVFPENSTEVAGKRQAGQSPAPR